MKTKSKMGMIDTKQLMLLIFVSRVAVSLTNIQAISIGEFAPDMLISVILAYFIVLLTSLPIVFCIKKNRSPLDSKWVSFAYSIYFSFYTAVTVVRFSYFASTKMNPEMSTEVFLLIMSLAMCYGAYLGIEGIARFGSFCALLLVVVMVIVLGLNINKFQPIYFYPSIVNTRQNVFYNAVLFSSNSMETALALALSGKINGDCTKALYKGVSMAFASIFLLVAFCIGVLGNNANLQSFPIFSLFQLASSKVLSRLDIIHTSFWILGVFMKCSLLIYCSSLSTKKGSNGFKCAAFSTFAFLLAYLSMKLLGVKLLSLTKELFIVLFWIFVAVIPLISLIIKRKKPDEEV